MKSVVPCFRIGSVPYLNAVPLTASLNQDVLFLPPSELAVELHAGRLDAALLSVTEIMGREEYEVLDGVGICSDGPVYSVFLAHQEPLATMGEVHLDPASCTSVNLLRVLLAEQGVSPIFSALKNYALAPQLRNVLLIGNPAIEYRRGPASSAIWDLGAAWKALTDLPFVYAVWALRRGAPAALAQHLRTAQAAGLGLLPDIVARRPDYDLGFRQAYLGGYIRYDLGEREKAGLARFGQLLRQHTGRRSVELRYV
jgi:chorismate dehydratase